MIVIVIILLILLLYLFTKSDKPKIYETLCANLEYNHKYNKYNKYLATPLGALQGTHSNFPFWNTQLGSKRNISYDLRGNIPVTLKHIGPYNVSSDIFI